MQIAPLALIISFSLLLFITTSLIIVSYASTQSPVRVENVTCRIMNDTKIIEITLRLPTPGYKISERHETMNETLLVNLTVRPPSGPVAQVITFTTISLRINQSISFSKTEILVNSTRVWSGPLKCEPGNQTASGNEAARKASANTAQGYDIEESVGSARFGRESLITAGVVISILFILFIIK